ncbi:response regulator [Pseudahrensia aquimaris]|uniref:Response regulator n=1 Tax=Pseudahrensia aquimaris TaxID=744461 RepID=A0ABW3FAV1_9HYPH
MAKILVTEDDEAVRAFVARALEMDGHEIVQAEDGEEGFDRLQEHEGVFDLLLTDIKMPYMDGIELAKTAALSYPSLKILFMTGFADQRERTGELSDIVIDVVSKPFSLQQIRDAVTTALKANHPAALKKAS